MKNNNYIMNACFIDVTIEFLSVAFHSILYYASVYPKTIFEIKKKYGIVVYRSCHPEVNQYIDNCLKSARECMKNGKLNRIVFAVTDSSYEPLLKFVFDIYKNEHYDDTHDAYLIQAEQNLRAFCLNLSSAALKFKDLSEDCSFTVYLHTNESTAVLLASDPSQENFPLVEMSDEIETSGRVIPLRKISIQNYDLDTYLEVKDHK